MKNPNLEITDNGHIRIHVPMRLKHKEGRKLVIAPKALDGDISDAPKTEQETILRAIATSWQWAKMVESGKVANVTELARKLKYSFQYTMRILSLVNLSPEVVEAIVYSREPDGLSLQKMINGYPEDWADQWKSFGFAAKESASIPGDTCISAQN